MGQSPIYALPWPEATDPADGPLGFENLAVAVESALTRPAVSALPPTPADGQVIVYKPASGTGGPWLLRYDATAPAGQRWRSLVQGNPVRAEVPNTTAGVSAAHMWPNVGTWTPTEVRPPLAGLWRAEATVGCYSGSTGVVGHIVLTTKTGTEPYTYPLPAGSAEFSPYTSFGGYQGNVISLRWAEALVPAGGRIIWAGAGGGGIAAVLQPPAWIDVYPVAVG